MMDQLITLIIGNLDDKREYKKMMKRVKVLPKEYQVAFKAIQKYLYTVGGVQDTMMIFTDLIDLFEMSVQDHKALIDVVGKDMGRFCEELMNSYPSESKMRKEKINQEIMDRFKKEGSS